MIASDTQIALNRAYAAWKFGGGSFVYGASTAQGGDITAPTVTSCTVAANGTTVTIVFSEACQTIGGTAGEFSIQPAGAIPAYVSGTGTNTFVLELDPADSVVQGTTVTLTFIPDPGVTDLAGNALVAFSGQVVTNNSTFPTNIATLSFLSNGSYYQDTGKTTPAAVGDPVRVWTYNVGADAVAPSDAARPVLRSGGLEFSGTKILDAAGDETTFATAGVFSLYAVGTVAADGTIWCPLGNWSGAGSAKGPIRFSDNTLYFTATGTISSAGWNAAGGLTTGSTILFRIRRSSSNVVYAYASGRSSETNVGTQAETVGWGGIGGRSTQLTSGNGLIKEVWLFASDVVADGTDVPIASYFFGKFGVILGT